MVVGGAGIVVGTDLGGERRPQRLGGQAPVPQQPLEHRIGKQPQFAGEDLQGHMAVAQVVGRLQQGQGVVGLQPQQLLLGGHHPHQRRALGDGGKPIAGPQGLAAGQLQQQRPTAAGVATAPQLAPFGRGEGQLRQNRIGRGRSPVAQEQGLGIIHAVHDGALLQHGAMDGWCATARLRFRRDGASGATTLQGGATAPLRLQRSQPGVDGRCRLPVLHTAGGLVGGDGLAISAELDAGSRALLTSVAAQKVYGSRGRSRLQPDGRWAQLTLEVELGPGADLEWLPQETVVFAGGLFEQVQRLQLAADASWLGIDVVRLGRTARGETLGDGCWRNRLELRRGERLELVERLQIDGDSLDDEHGLAGQPVFATLVWAAPAPLPATDLQAVLDEGRRDAGRLQGQGAVGALEQGLIARYRGPSSQEARRWFRRLWAQSRRLRGLAAPEPLREWPLQEEP